MHDQGLPHFQPPSLAHATGAAATLDQGRLAIGGTTVLTGVPKNWQLAPSIPEGAALLRSANEPGTSHAEIPLGQFSGVMRFTSGARRSPFWIRPVFGTSTSQVHAETLWILTELTGGGYLLLVPLVGTRGHGSLVGTGEGLRLVVDTGDPLVAVDGDAALLAAVGSDPYELTAFAARTMAGPLRLGRLRADKPVPDFVDLFGWCTWDAFYQEVSADKVVAGLAGFAAGGVRPRFVILDDGWQAVTRAPTGETRLTGFGTNERFAGGLAPLIAQAKQKYGVERFLVWHALLGYWGGVDGTALPGYGVRPVPRAYGPGILRLDPHANVRPWGALTGVPGATEAARFFDDYHASLREQGVDGVKVDNQGMLESVSAGQGGRMVLGRAFRRALETSVARHFSSRLINCMACNAECAYLTESSVLMRTSDDFWPRRADTHGLHLLTNAQTAVWFGEFILPDWDMFQSQHPAGSLHAAARAIAGGPIYVSDAPGAHDFALLRKLVVSDGAVLRPDGVGRPSPSCLFVDPTREHALLKIFNTNRDAGVLGLFNVHTPQPGDEIPISGSAAVRDLPPLRARDHAAFAHRQKSVHRLQTNEELPVTLRAGEWEIFTFAPVEHDFAAFGLADKLNSGGAITAREWTAGDTCVLDLRDGGLFIAWSAQRPLSARVDGRDVAWRHTADGRLEIDLPVGTALQLTLHWQSAGSR